MASEPVYRAMLHVDMAHTDSGEMGLNKRPVTTTENEIQPHGTSGTYNGARMRPVSVT